MKSNLLFTAVIAIILLNASCRKDSAPAPAPVVYNPYSAIDKVLNDSVPFRFNSRCYALISVNGKIVYSKSYGGYLDSTVEKVASCSKWISGAVMMTLVDQGKLALSDTVGKYLPVFSQYHKGNITLAQLFAHTSGFPGNSAQGYENNESLSLSQCADSIAKNVPLMAQPGAKFDFGNVSMQVAGRICEVVSGKKWNELFTENIAAPCNMINTNYGLGLNPSIANGASSSARDYSFFLYMIMNNGVAMNGNRILSQAAINAMEQGETSNATITYSPYPRWLLPASNYYGLGNWRDVTAPGDSLVEGSSPGAFGTHPWINREKKITGIIFTYVPGQKNEDSNGATMATCIKIRKLVRDIVQ
ncbi:MAG TPA: serine hydrolase domain-containing protein [Mucilaginibacter sp.]|jgi:CubicO group peptidase (beta-lactamase class C family)|nr:serine hydrolase domain-containing protein [Mucilaginibacter sp.]